MDWHLVTGFCNESVTCTNYIEQHSKTSIWSKTSGNSAYCAHDQDGVPNVNPVLKVGTIEDFWPKI